VVAVNIEATGKGKKAQDRLEAIGSQVSDISRKLDKAHETLITHILGKTTNSETKGKKRSSVKNVPDRIEFKLNGLPFYIDFTISAVENEGLTSVEGCIVYGVNRPLCFLKCLFPKTDGCKYCDRVPRCDRFEDKPLVKFSINRDGILRSSGDLDDQWRISDTGKKDEEEENNKNILDLNYRALDHIWRDALDWTNENILP